MRVTHRLSDLLQHGVEIGQYLIVPETQDPIAVVGQPRRPTLIDLNLTDVVPAVNLNDNAVFEATEVHNVAANGMLAPELGAVEPPITQMHP